MKILKNIFSLIYTMDEETMSHDTIMNFGLGLMRFSGQNVMNDGPIQRVISVVSFLYVAFFITSVGFLPFYVDNDNEIIDIIERIMTFSIYLPALIHFRLNLDVLKDLLNIEKFWPIDYVDEESAVQQRKIYKITYNCIKMPVYLGFFTMSSTILAPFFLNTRKTPLDCYHIFTLDNLIVYIITFIMQVVMLIGFCAFIVSLIAIVVGNLSFTYCQMIMLKKSIEISDREIFDENAFYERLIQHMKYYSSLLRYFRMINKMFSVPFLLLWSVELLSCGVQFFTIVNYDNDHIKADKSFFYPDIVGNVLFLTIQCYIITAVVDQIKSMGDAVYNSNWTSFLTPRIKCATNVIVMRAQKGVQFKCAGIVDVNMEVCTTALQFVYSLYTFFSAINK